MTASDCRLREGAAAAAAAALRGWHRSPTHPPPHSLALSLPHSLTPERIGLGDNEKIRAIRTRDEDSEIERAGPCDPPSSLLSSCLSLSLSLPTSHDPRAHDTAGSHAPITPHEGLGCHAPRWASPASPCMIAAATAHADFYIVPRSIAPACPVLSGLSDPPREQAA